MVRSILFFKKYHTNFPLVEEPMEADTKSTSLRQFLRPPSPSQESSSPISEQAEGINGREKRVRKSINYAEPKLNTYVHPSLSFDYFDCLRYSKEKCGNLILCLATSLHGEKGRQRRGPQPTSRRRLRLPSVMHPRLPLSTLTHNSHNWQHCPSEPPT